MLIMHAPSQELKDAGRFLHDRELRWSLYHIPAPSHGHGPRMQTLHARFECAQSLRTKRRVTATWFLTSHAAVVTSCHNCVDGLFDVIKHHQLGMQVKLLVNLVASALVIPARPIKARRPLEGYKILVIEDEPDVRVYLAKIFKDQGCEVIEAPDANQAMRAIRAELPDLITLDLILPHMTGEKLYWELRKDERTARVPVVVVSGYAAVDSPRIDFHGFLAEKKLAQPEGFLEKPVVPEKLIETVQVVLLERGRTAAEKDQR